MAIKKFSQREALEFSWETTRAHLEFFIGLSMIITILTLAPAAIYLLIREKITLPYILNNKMFIIALSGALGLIHAIAILGLIKITIKIYDNKNRELDALSSAQPLYSKFITGGFLYGLTTAGRIILLIVLGIICIKQELILGIGFIISYVGIIILSLQFRYWLHVITDQDVGLVDALKRSARITTWVKWDLFLFDLLLILINSFGILCFGIGLLVTIPLTGTAETFVYRKLLGQTDLTKLPAKGKSVLVTTGLLWFIFSLIFGTLQFLKPLPFSVPQRQVVPIQNRQVIPKRKLPKQLETNIKDYQILTTGNPRDTKLRLKLGDLYYSAQNYAQAIDSYKKALKLGGESEDIYLKLGNSYYDAGNPLEAVKYYQQTLELNPKLNDIRIDMATMYREIGQLDKAIEALRKVNEIDPKHRTAYFNLGIILHNDKKDLVGAKTSWGKFLELAPNSPDAKQVKKAITDIDKELGRQNLTNIDSGVNSRGG